MPKITLPENTPWWVVGLLAFVLVLAYAIRIVANAVLPRQSDHRLSWWREWWGHRKDIRAEKRNRRVSTSPASEVDQVPSPAGRSPQVR